jgi:hypothetical protein
MRFCISAVITSLTLLTTAAVAGPFTNPSISASDPAIAAWASSVVDFAPTSSGSASGAAALGPSDATPAAANGASLGDLTADQIANQTPPGHIAVKFTTPFRNGAGWDLAVFENAGTFFDAPFVFAELAYVEVSSDGANFARFLNDSLNTEPGAGTADTDLVVPFGRDFAGLNPTNVHNLAGIHPAGFGTQFDLDDLLTNALVTGGLVNLNAIQYVRIIDIPGNGSFLDSSGRPILDTWSTAVGTTGGLDLDAVAARFVPEPSAILLAACGAASLMAVGFVRRRRHRKA